MKVRTLILATVSTLVAAGALLAAPPRAQYCSFWGGLHESCHFTELGFIRIGPNPTTNLSERVKEAIDHIGMEHRHRHPELIR